MIEFLAAHKVGLLLGAVLAGGLIFYMRKRGSSSSAYANGVPVDPYAANANPASGGFDLGSLLPQGPAGPILDPTADPGTQTGQDSPSAVTQAFTPEPSPSGPAQAVFEAYQAIGSPAYVPGSIAPTVSLPTYWSPPPVYNPVTAPVRAGVGDR